jgi:hypothetical protein
MTQPLSSHGTLLKMGDGAGSLGSVSFTGSGTDDMTLDAAAAYQGHLSTTYRVEIDGTGTPDTFKWSRDQGVTWEAENVPIAGAATEMELEFGVLIEFAATTGHTSGDYWEFTAAPVLTTVAEIVDIGGPSNEQAVHDAPSQDITWMKKVAGLVTAGEVSLGVNLIPKDATHDATTGLLSLLGLQYTTAWQLIYNDAGAGTASVWNFSAYMTAFDQDAPVDGILAAAVTLNINGIPQFVEGS